MRLLLLQNSVYVPTHGGANKANRLLLEALASRGHTCTVVGSGAAVQGAAAGRDGFLRELAARDIPVRCSTPDADIFELAGVTVYAARGAAHLRACATAALRDADPTWVLVASEDPGQNLLEAAVDRCPERVVFLARTTMTLPVGPDAAVPSSLRAQLLWRVAAIVCVSAFLARYVRRWTRHPHVATLPISFIEAPAPDWRGDPDNGFVTMINPCALKGLPIFEALARQHEAIRFAAVSSWGTTSRDRAVLADLPNVTLLPATDVMGDIFARTRILLVPSLWAEAWGRVVPEAMLHGIPVMAANVGGLPEAKLGVPYLLPVAPIDAYSQALDERMIPIPHVPVQDVTPWSDALHVLTTDRAHYDRIARDSRDAARSFVAGNTVDQFEQYLLALPRGAERTPASMPRAESIDADSEAIASAGAPASSSTDVLRTIDTLPPDRRAALLQLLIARAAGGGTDTGRLVVHAATPAGAASLDHQPLSFAQERLWFLHQVDPDSPAYNVAQAFRIRGALDVPALARAVNTIVARHAVLRTTFPARDGRPIALTCDALTVPLSLIDVTDLPSRAREQLASDLAVREARRPFALGAGPLLRACLLCLGTHDHVLLLLAHHIIVDYWSLGVFIDELDAAYRDALIGQQSSLPALPLQYAEYARWQRDHLARGAGAQLDFWKQQLGDLPPLSLPGEMALPRSGRSARDDAGAVRRFALPASMPEILGGHARREGVSVYMLLLAAYALTLHWISRQRDFAIACPIAGRTRTETERLIGFFVNTLVIRARLADEMTCRDLVHQVRGTTLAAYAHQDVPFERIVEAVRPARDATAMPLCRVLFVLQNVPDTRLRMHTLNLDPLDLDLGTIRFDLELIMLERAGTLSGRLMYRTARLTPLLVGRIVHGYLAAVEELLGDPHRTVAAMTHRLDAAQAAREHGTQRALQRQVFTTLTQAGRATS